MRVLVTGSRDWPWQYAVHMTLRLALASRPDELLTVVHGDCPTGADRMAREWCERVLSTWRDAPPRLREERHPADWSRYGKRAGFVRNAEMVALGADVVLAFRFNGSRGTTDTIERAEAAGLTVEVWDAP